MMDQKDMELGAELIGTVVGIMIGHLKDDAKPNWKYLENKLLEIVNRPQKHKCEVCGNQANNSWVCSIECYAMTLNEDEH